MYLAGHQGLKGLSGYCKVVLCFLYQKKRYSDNKYFPGLSQLSSLVGIVLWMGVF